MQTFIDLLLTCNSPATYLPRQVNDASQKDGFYLVYDYQYVISKRFENGREGGRKWTVSEMKIFYKNPCIFRFCILSLSQYKLKLLSYE